MNKKLGVFPTMITPYTEKNEVDYEGVKKLVKWYWEKGCDGIFAVCQSSEIFFLALEERVRIAQTVIETAKALAQSDQSRKPMKIVVSGHVSDSFADQVKELNAMAKTGADGLILISNRMDVANTTEEKWIEDMQKLIAAIASDIPLGLYECPKPYKRLLTEKMIKACVETGRFAFIKDTCCDAAMVKLRLEWLKDTDIGLYNANAQTLLETLRYGADGYCGVMANFHPELYSWLFYHTDDVRADEVQSLLGICAFTESLAYPATAKWYLNEYEEMGITSLSRAVDCKLITDYQKGCLAQMKILTDGIKARLQKQV